LAHVSLYRKYRPASFEEVVGQEHVTRTLENAIVAGKVNHAYLFAGSRGTGKTSTAKLLAKALNCAEGPTARPCGKCESCVSISAGTSMDVIEMDAASNRGIDDIRSIRDKIAFSPVKGRSKVYILDEAHMLTKEASNAFLKVLEEPPAHVIFVLCTTEAFKVLPTIQSRCQKFEFRRPDAGMVHQVLKRIAVTESIDIDEAGLAAIARSSAGSFRDAIGALDQLAAYCAGKISLADVLSMLGAVESDLLFEAVDIVAELDVRSAILFINRLAERGRDFGRFAAELVGHLRNLFLLQQLDDYPDGLIDAADEDMARLRGQSRVLAPHQVMRFIELLLAAQAEIKRGSDPRLQLELAFIAMTRPEVDMSTKSLLYRVEQLEKQQQLSAAGVAASVPVAPKSSQSSTGQDETKATARVPEPETAAREPAPPAPQLELSLDKISRAWGVILTQVRRRKIPLYSLLQEARPVDLSGNVLVLGFPPEAGFHKTQVEKPNYVSILTEVLKELTGVELKIRCVRTDSGAVKEEKEVPSQEEIIAMIKEELGAEEI